MAETEGISAGADMNQRPDYVYQTSVILSCLPGTTADIAKRSGYCVTTVRRTMRDHVAAGTVHQSGWLHVWHSHAPLYAAGPPPEGFTLPPKPPARRQSERSAEWRAKPRGRQLSIATSRRAYERNREKVNARASAWAKANREKINKQRRDNRAAKRAAEALKREAFDKTVVQQLTAPKWVYGLEDGNAPPTHQNDAGDVQPKE